MMILRNEPILRLCACLLLILFIAAYTLVHVISWVQIRYRMPVDVALAPFAALAVVGLTEQLRRGRRIGNGV